MSSGSSPILVDMPASDLITSISPADARLLRGAGLDRDDITIVELSTGSELYELWTAYIVEHAEHLSSYQLSIGRDKSCCAHDSATSKRVVTPSLGLGLHKLETKDGKTLFALKQTLGAPVGTECGATMMVSLVLFSPVANDIAYLAELSTHLVAEADKVAPSSFTVWRWNINYGRWMRGSV